MPTVYRSSRYATTSSSDDPWTVRRSPRDRRPATKREHFIEIAGRADPFVEQQDLRFDAGRHGECKSCLHA